MGKKTDFNSLFNRKSEMQYNYIKQLPLYSKKPQHTQLRYIYGLAYCFQIINENTKCAKEKKLPRKETYIQVSYITRTLTVFEIKKSIRAT